MITIAIVKQSHSTLDLVQALGSAENKPLSPYHQSLFDRVAESQYKIAKYLSKHKGAIVIQEEGKTLFQGQYKQDEKEIAAIFPRGLPGSYDQLSFLQKKALVYKGGSGFSVLSHAIEKVHADSAAYADDMKSFFISSKQIKPDSPEWYSGISELDQKREFATLRMAEKIAVESKKAEVILIYGQAHLFSDIIPCFPNLKLVIHDFSIQQGKSAYSTKQYQQKYNFFRPAPHCMSLALNLAYKERRAKVAVPELAAPIHTSHSLETAPFEIFLRLAIYAGSRWGICEKPLEPLVLSPSLPEEVSAEMHFSKQGTSLESALRATLKKTYSKGTWMNQLRWKNFFTDIVNGKVDRNMGNKFNNAILLKPHQRVKKLKGLLKEYESSLTDKSIPRLA